MAHRLVETKDLTLPITAIRRAELYADIDGQRRLLQADAATDRHLRAALKIIAGNVSASSVTAYLPWICSYWQLAMARQAALDDQALFRGWIQALVTGKYALKKSSIHLAVSAINALCAVTKKKPPKDDSETKAWLRGVYFREKRPVEQAAPILAEDLRELVSQARARDDLRGLRDAALLLVGWHCALRRSEVCRLAVGDIKKAPRSKHYLVTVRDSKTDKNHAGQTVPLYRTADPALDPIAALDEWLSESGITSGSIFRSIGRFGNVSATPLVPRSIAHILDQYVMPKSGISAHSLRSGFITESGMQGKSLPDIMVTSRHGSMEVARSYLRKVDVVGQGVGPLV